MMALVRLVGGKRCGGDDESVRIIIMKGGREKRT